MVYKGSKWGGLAFDKFVHFAIICVVGGERNLCDKITIVSLIMQYV